MSGRFATGGWDRAQVQAYSDRAGLREAEDQPLAIELIVRVQQLAARGRSVDQIVEALARCHVKRAEVLRALMPAETATRRKLSRPTHANVGYRHLKRGPYARR